MTRKCLNCDKDISNFHGRQQRCPDTCAKIYKRERYRLYMSKYNLKKRGERIAMRTECDNALLADGHMTGLGTFHLTKKPHSDIIKEYKDILRLKKQCGLK